MQEFKTFPAKILLFGEHIINKGSNGMALPFHKYNCTLSFEKNDSSLKESKEVLNLILNQINEDDQLSEMFDIVSFEQDIHQGLFLNMDIPIGYGLGSSGAICAGVYEKYCHTKHSNPRKIQTILGKIESAFHGKSSGLDPLVSYIDKAVLVKKDDTEIIDFSLDKIEGFHIFLIDTKQARKTAPLVNSFLEKYESDSSFSQIVDEDIVPLTNKIIENFIDSEFQEILSEIKQLSVLQLDNFKDLILEKHLSIWKKGILNNEFYLKICGAGAGGFMLGFCKDKSCVLDAFEDNEILFL